MAQQASEAQRRWPWQRGCRQDAAMRGKELEELQPHAHAVLSTATATQLFDRVRKQRDFQASC